MTYEILNFRNSQAEMHDNWNKKNAGGINIKYEQVEKRSSELVDKTTEMTKSGVGRKRDKEKWTESERHVGDHQENKHAHVGINTRRRRRWHK